jgi:exosome complex RNA-binding protein Rrp42 (RNase PH superfamily)
MRTFIIICTLNDKKICLIKKLGGFCLSPGQFNLCIEQALKNGQILRKNVYHKFKINNNNNNSITDE